MNNATVSTRGYQLSQAVNQYSRAFSSSYIQPISTHHIPSYPIISLTYPPIFLRHFSSGSIFLPNFSGDLPSLGSQAALPLQCGHGGPLQRWGQGGDGQETATLGSFNHHQRCQKAMSFQETSESTKQMHI